jgi:hypothetical protein
VQRLRQASVLGRVLSAAIVLLAADAAAQRMGAQIPLTITFDACVLPSEACTARRDVVRLIAGGETHQVALANLRVMTGERSRGQVLSDLHARARRLLGARELVARFTPGAQLAVRATMRRDNVELFLQSVTPLD